MRYPAGATGRALSQAPRAAEARLLRALPATGVVNGRRASYQAALPDGAALEAIRVLAELGLVHVMGDRDSRGFRPLELTEAGRLLRADLLAATGPPAA